jgi:nucleotide-binding universal stress UspA family protein/nitrite reductase/ring-hydroxylating ferredoxin subunit
MAAHGKILVGTDGSETAQIAERVAIRLTGASQGLLVILSAFQRPEQKASAERAVEAARERAERHGVQPTTEVVAGEPAGAIVDAADRMMADLVVVGDVGMGGPKRFRLGGVADQVSHHMPCDLLIVRTAKHDPDAVPASYDSVLITTDGSPTADRAARTGTEVAVMMGAGVTLVRVGDRLMGDIILKDTADRLGDVDLPVRVIEQGDPGERIVEVARDDAHDLVVVGNKGMAGPRRFLLGSVPDTVSHLAPCDVLIVNTVGLRLQDLRPGEGGIVSVDGKDVAAYREESGDVVLLSPRCQHLGCPVGWNDAAKTWDCPCHGSRYDAHGKVIQGPAERDLNAVQAGPGGS